MLDRQKSLKIKSFYWKKSWKNIKKNPDLDQKKSPDLYKIF